MKNYSGSGKYKGILAFANNSPTVRYEDIANKTLQLASRSTGLPVHLIIGQRNDDWNNTRRDVNTNALVKWNNHSRYHAYELSPFDETIVIDIDLLLTTDRVLKLFDNTEDYVLCHSNDTLHKKDNIDFDLVWATVFMFRKTPRAKEFFDLVGRIQNNWTYYKRLFGVRVHNFRNDYAFAMAERILNGHTTSPHTRMPWGIVTADGPVKSIDINANWMVVRTQDQADILPRCDLHVMSKEWLQSPALDKFIEQAK